MNGADFEDGDDWFLNINDGGEVVDDPEEDGNQLLLLDTADGLAVRLSGETEAEKVDALIYALRSVNGEDTFGDCAEGDPFGSSPQDYMEIICSSLFESITSVYSSVYDIISLSPLSDTIHSSFKEFAKQLSSAVHSTTTIKNCINELREESFEKEEDLLRMHNQLTVKETQIEELKKRLQQKEISIKDLEEETSDVAVVLVQIESAMFLMKSAKSEFTSAMLLFNTLFGSLLELFEGTLINSKEINPNCEDQSSKVMDSFAILFPDPSKAILFLISLQQELLRQDWSELLLRYSACKHQTTESGDVLWSGLRVRCSADVGPVVEVGEKIFSGPMLQKSSVLLDNASGGSCLISGRLWDVFREKKDHRSEFQQLVASVHAVPIEVPEIRDQQCWLLFPFSLSQRTSSSNDRTGRFSEVDYWEAPIQEAAQAAAALPLSPVQSVPEMRRQSVPSEPPSVSSFILNKKEAPRLRRIVSRLTKNTKDKRSDGLKRAMSKRGMSSVAMEKSKEKLNAVKKEVEKVQKELQETQERLQWYASELGDVINDLRSNENKRLEIVEGDLMFTHDKHPQPSPAIVGNKDTKETTKRSSDLSSHRFRIRRRLRTVAGLVVRTSENPVFQGSLQFIHSISFTFHNLLKEFLKRGQKTIPIDQVLTKFTDSAIRISHPLYSLSFRERLLALSKQEISDGNSSVPLSVHTEAIISLMVRSLLLFRVMKRNSKSQSDSRNTSETKERKTSGGHGRRKSRISSENNNLNAKLTAASRRFSEFGGMEQRQRDLQQRIRDRRDIPLDKPRGNGSSAAMAVRTSLGSAPRRAVVTESNSNSTNTRTTTDRASVPNNLVSPTITPRRLNPIKKASLPDMPSIDNIKEKRHTIN